MVIIFYGLPGSGKSTLAKEYAHLSNYIYLCNDEIRAKYFPEHDYTENGRMKVYSLVLLITDILLRQGKTVVIDSTFSNYIYRKNVIELCAKLGTIAIFVKCSVELGECKKRIATRENANFSEANSEVVNKLFESWDDDADDILNIDTSMSKQKCLNAIFSFVEKAVRHSSFKDVEVLPAVPLTPSKINIVNDIPSLNNILKVFHEFFKKHQIEWYIQSSLAAHIYGVEDRNVTDIDLRVNADLNYVYDRLIEDTNFSVRIRGHVRYEYGEFRNDCLIIDIPELDTHIDITSKIITYRRDRDIIFDVPFDNTYRMLSIANDLEVKYPVCSPEYLVVYKFVNQRGKNERKNDIREASHLMKLIFNESKTP